MRGPPIAWSDLTIEAPIDVVWSILTDLGGYPSWNPFIVAVSCEEAAPRVGLRMKVRVEWPRGGGSSSVEETTALEPPGAGVAGTRSARWGYAFRGALAGLGLVRAQRVQSLAERGDGRTVYESSLVFDGPLSRFVPIEKVQAGQDAMASALKARAESDAPRRSSVSRSA